MKDSDKLRALAEWIPKYFGHRDTPQFPDVSTKDLRRIADELEKTLSDEEIEARYKMREQAITVFELTKGFTGSTTDNAMKTALEMAEYVMRLTNDLPTHERREKLTGK